MHLMLNHFPIIGTILGTGVMVYGYFTRSEATQRAALLTWFLMALAAIPVFLTGEPAEESVEGLAGVSEALIEQHEAAAELALWFMEALGVLSLAAFFLQTNKKILTGLAFVLSLVTFGLMARTGYLGGQIRHTEIRSGATGQATGEQATETGAAKDDEKDDD